MILSKTFKPAVYSVFMAWKRGILAGILALAGGASCMQGAAPSERAGDAGAIAGIEDKVEKYALLISGRTEARHVLHMSLAYNLLLEQGFERENIRVLDEYGQERHYLYPVDGKASRETIGDAIDELKKRVDSNDLLFVYVSNHGDKQAVCGDKGVQVISLPGEDMNYMEFMQHMDGINPMKGLFIFDHCYSGAFAKAAGSGAVTAVSASGAEEMAYAQTGEFNSAGANFILAFKNKEDSDANNDGRVSVQEAFDYMLQNHTETIECRQHPEIHSDLSPEDVYFFD